MGVDADPELLRRERDQAVGTTMRVLGESTRLVRVMTVLTEPTLSLETLVDRVLVTMSDLFYCDVAAVRAPRRGHTMVTLGHLGTGLLGDIWPSSEDDQSPGCQALIGDNPVLLSGPDALDAVLPAGATLGLKAGLWMPLRVHRPVGYLVLLRTVDEPFTESEIDILERIGGRLAFAIDQAVRAERLQRIAQLAAELSSGLHKDLVSQRAVEVLADILDADAAAVLLIDDDVAHAAAAVGIEPEYVKAWAEPASRLVAWQKATAGDQLLADDLQEVIDQGVGPADLRSAMASGLVGPDGAFGLVYVFRREVRPFDSLDGELCKLIAAQVSAALRNAASFAVSVETAERERAEASSLRVAQQALRESEHRFRALVEQADDFIAVVDEGGVARWVGPSFARSLGYSEDALSTDAPFQLLHPHDESDFHALVAEVASSRGMSGKFSARVRHSDGSWRRMEGTMRNLLEDPAVKGLVLNARDVTERERLAERLRHRAYHDDLTGLANRALLLEQLEGALRTALRERTNVALIFLDIDRFKSINDGLGHAVGDRLLRGVGHAIADAVREGDLLARLGGDEFIVLAQGVSGEEEVVGLANRILRAVHAPIDIGGRELLVTGSLGLAISYAGDTDAHRLLRDADIALYRAKAAGRNCWRLFEPVMQQGARRALEMETELRHALRRKQIAVHYQPICRLVDREVIGYEALMRWTHPHFGRVSPSEFIPLAEESGMMLDLDEHVLRTSLDQVAAWQARTGRPAQVGVNISAAHFQWPSLAEFTAGLLEERGLMGSALVIELTENLLVERSATVMDNLHALRALGVSICVDDFGTGYSSLSYLRTLPLDVLKIDMSFVAEVETDPVAAALVEAIMAMGRSLSLGVVAEGIETEGQMARLISLGVPYGQGYLLGRPSMPTAESVESLPQISLPAPRP